jgi:hypothetical protein
MNYNDTYTSPPRSIYLESRGFAQIQTTATTVERALRRRRAHRDDEEDSATAHGPPHPRGEPPRRRSRTARRRISLPPLRPPPTFREFEQCEMGKKSHRRNMTVQRNRQPTSGTKYKQRQHRPASAWPDNQTRQRGTKQTRTRILIPTNDPTTRNVTMP